MDTASIADPGDPDQIDLHAIACAVVGCDVAVVPRARAALLAE
jgi:hypothetical protein